MKDSFTEKHKFKIYIASDGKWYIGYKSKKGFSLFWKNVEYTKGASFIRDPEIEIKSFDSKQLATKFLEDISSHYIDFRTIEDYQNSIYKDLDTLKKKIKKDRKSHYKTIYIN